MGDGFYLAVIKHQCSFQKSFPVSGGAGVNDLDTFRKLTVLADKCDLCCRGTCVNTEIAVSGIVFQVTGFYMIVSVPAGKSIVIFLAGKQRVQTGNFKLQLNAGGKTLLQRS